MSRIQMGTVFCEDVVLDSFNKASTYEDSILDQIYYSKYVWVFIMMILILYNIVSTKKHTKTTVALKLKLLISLFLCAVFLYI